MIYKIFSYLKSYRVKLKLRRLKEIFFRKPEPAWLSEIVAIDARFDKESGFETGGIVDLKRLTIAGDNSSHGHRYIAVRPDEFDAAFKELRVDVSDFTFIDIGSGKGRALILAAQHPFKNIIGVEFAHELHLVAKANTLRLDKPITTLWIDATKYDFPTGALIIFLYNPFGAEIMNQVADRVKLLTGPIIIMYLNPFEEKSWTDRGFLRSTRGPTFSILTQIPI